MSRIYSIYFISLLLHWCYASHLSRRAELTHCPADVLDVFDAVTEDIRVLAEEGYLATRPPIRTDEGQRTAEMWAQREQRHQHFPWLRRSASDMFRRIHTEAASTLRPLTVPSPPGVAELVITCEDVDYRCRSHRNYAYRSYTARGGRGHVAGRRTVFVICANRFMILPRYEDIDEVNDQFSVIFQLFARRLVNDRIYDSLLRMGRIHDLWPLISFAKRRRGNPRELSDVEQALLEMISDDE
ncbi:MAG: hypothetical protein Q9160_007425 [Pyrenula sp. 1 TL-2023]